MRPWTSKLIHNLSAWRAAHEHSRVLLTNGCFDLLHSGHVIPLQAAKARHPDAVFIVAVNSNNSVQSLKGPKRPIIDENSRLHLIGSLEIVDYCFLFSDVRLNSIISILRPNIWLKSGYTTSTLDASELAAATAIGCELDLPAVTPNFSTTNIISKCASISQGEKLAGS